MCTPISCSNLTCWVPPLGSPRFVWGAKLIKEFDSSMPPVYDSTAKILTIYTTNTLQNTGSIPVVSPIAWADNNTYTIKDITNTPISTTVSNSLPTPYTIAPGTQVIVGNTTVIPNPFQYGTTFEYSGYSDLTSGGHHITSNTLTLSLEYNVTINVVQTTTSPPQALIHTDVPSTPVCQTLIYITNNTNMNIINMDVTMNGTSLGTYNINAHEQIIIQSALCPITDPLTGATIPPSIVANLPTPGTGIVFIPPGTSPDYSTLVTSPGFGYDANGHYIPLFLQPASGITITAITFVVQQGGIDVNYSPEFLVDPINGITQAKVYILDPIILGQPYIVSGLLNWLTHQSPYSLTVVATIPSNSLGVDPQTPFLNIALGTPIIDTDGLLLYTSTLTITNPVAITNDTDITLNEKVQTGLGPLLSRDPIVPLPPYTIASTPTIQYRHKQYPGQTTHAVYMSLGSNVYLSNTVSFPAPVVVPPGFPPTPSFTITMSHTILNADKTVYSSPKFDKSGQYVHMTYTVTPTYDMNEPLTTTLVSGELSVAMEMPGGPPVTFDYLVTQDDIDFGIKVFVPVLYYLTNGLATATYPVRATQSPSMTITNVTITPTVPFIVNGSLLTVTGTITNTGNVTLTNLQNSYSVDQIAIPSVFTSFTPNIPIVNVGGTSSTSFTYIVKQADIDGAQPFKITLGAVSDQIPALVSGSNTISIQQVYSANVTLGFTDVLSPLQITKYYTKTSSPPIVASAVTPVVVIPMYWWVENTGNTTLNTGKLTTFVVDPSITGFPLSIGDIIPGATSTGTVNYDTTDDSTSTVAVQFKSTFDNLSDTSSNEVTLKRLDDDDITATISGGTEYTTVDIDYEVTVMNVIDIHFVADIYSTWVLTGPNSYSVTGESTHSGNTLLSSPGTLTMPQKITLTNEQLSQGTSITITGMVKIDDYTTVTVPNHITITKKEDNKCTLTLIEGLNPIDNTVLNVFKITGTNTGNTTINAASLSLTNLTPSTAGPSTLYNNATVSIASASLNLSDADLEKDEVVVSATLTGTYLSSTSEEIVKTVDLTIDLIKYKSFTCVPDTTVLVTYETVGKVYIPLKITNTGKIPLRGTFSANGIDLTNSSGDAIGVTTVAVGENVTYYMPYTVKDADLDVDSVVLGITGSYIGTGTALSSTSGSQSYTVTKNAVYTVKITSVRAIPIKYPTTGNIDPTRLIVTVQNTGNMAWTNLPYTISSANALVAGDNNAHLSLTRGSSVDLNASLSSYMANFDIAINITRPGPALISDTYNFTYEKGDIIAASIVQKSLSPIPSTSRKAGDSITVTLTIANTGNIELTDPYYVVAGETGVTLSPMLYGALLDISFVHTITQIELDAGSFSYKVDVFDNNVLLTSTGITSINLPQTREVTFSALSGTIATSTAYPVVGDTIKPTYTIKNAGNVTLTNLVIQIDPMTINTISSIAPGDAVNVISDISFPITRANINAGKWTYSLSAVPQSVGASVSYDVLLSQNYASEIQSQMMKINGAPGISYKSPSDVLTVEYTFRNTGNTDLLNISGIFRNFIGGTMSSDLQTDTVVGPIHPGDQFVLTVKKENITQSDIDSDSSIIFQWRKMNVDTNKEVTVTVASGGPTGWEVVTFLASQTKTVEYTATGSPLSYGEIGTKLTITHTFKNTGNVTLKYPNDFSVNTTGMRSDFAPLSVTTTPPLPNTTLLPGGDISYDSIYIITGDDVVQGSSLTFVCTPTSVFGSGVSFDVPSVSLTFTEDAHMLLQIVRSNSGDFATSTISNFTEFEAAGSGVSVRCVLYNAGTVDVDLSTVTLNTSFKTYSGTDALATLTGILSPGQYSGNIILNINGTTVYTIMQEDLDDNVEGIDFTVSGTVDTTNMTPLVLHLKEKAATNPTLYISMPTVNDLTGTGNCAYQFTVSNTSASFLNVDSINITFGTETAIEIDTVGGSLLGSSSSIPPHSSIYYATTHLAPGTSVGDYTVSAIVHAHAGYTNGLVCSKSETVYFYRVSVTPSVSGNSYKFRVLNIGNTIIPGSITTPSIKMTTYFHKSYEYGGLDPVDTTPDTSTLTLPLGPGSYYDFNKTLSLSPIEIDMKTTTKRIMDSLIVAGVPTTFISETGSSLSPYNPAIEVSALAFNINDFYSSTGLIDVNYTVGNSGNITLKNSSLIIIPYTTSTLNGVKSYYLNVGISISLGTLVPTTGSVSGNIPFDLSTVSIPPGIIIGFEANVSANGYYANDSVVGTTKTVENATYSLSDLSALSYTISNGGEDNNGVLKYTVNPSRINYTVSGQNTGSTTVPVTVIYRWTYPSDANNMAPIISQQASYNIGPGITLPLTPTFDVNKLEYFDNPNGITLDVTIQVGVGNIIKKTTTVTVYPLQKTSFSFNPSVYEYTNGMTAVPVHTEFIYTGNYTNPGRFYMIPISLYSDRELWIQFSNIAIGTVLKGDFSIPVTSDDMGPGKTINMNVSIFQSAMIGGTIWSVLPITMNYVAPNFTITNINVITANDAFGYEFVDKIDFTINNKMSADLGPLKCYYTWRKYDGVSGLPIMWTSPEITCPTITPNGSVSLTLPTNTEYSYVSEERYLCDVRITVTNIPSSTTKESVWKLY